MRIAKTLASIAVLSLFALVVVVSAQEPKALTDLPKVVQKTVNTNYPDAKIRGLSKEKNEAGETVYEIEMTVKGKAIDIIVDSQGDIDVIEEEIDAAALPKAVQATASKTFPTGKITRAEKVTDDAKKVTYEILVKVGEKDPFEVLMAPDGKVLKDGSKPAAPAAPAEKEEKAKPKK